MYSVDPTLKNENSDVTCTSCIQGKSLYEMLTNCAKNWTAWSLSCSNRIVSAIANLRLRPGGGILPYKV